MPSFFVRNDTVQNGIGYAIPNVAVTYYTQPSLALATVYATPDGSGGPIANPQFTNGLGETTAYLASGLYTITYSGAQIQTLTLADQDIGQAGSGSTVTTFAGTPQGTVNGVNRVFTLTNDGTPLTVAPSIQEVWLNFPLVQGVGYTISGVIITFAVAPTTNDTIFAQGVTIS